MDVQVPISALHKNGMVLGASRRNSATTYSYPIVYQDPETKQSMPVVCQTPWLWLPSPPRFVYRNHRRVHFFHVTFWDLKTNPEQQKWLHFLRGIQRELFRWVVDKRDDRVTNHLHWLDTLENVSDTPRYMFADEMATKLRRSKRLRHKSPKGTKMSAPSKDATKSSDSKYSLCAEHICTEHDHEQVRWKISTHLSKKVHCYDTTRTQIPPEQFMSASGFTPKYVRLLVQFTNVWVNEQSNTAGLALNVLQIQQNDVEPLRTYAFLDVVPEYMRHRPPGTDCSTQTDPVKFDSNDGTSRDVSSATTDGSGPLNASSQGGNGTTSAASQRMEHPVYGKYFKMVSKGVPKQGVKHKMRMDGLDPDILDLPEGEPLPTCDLPSAGIGDQLSLSLQDTQQLRKTEVNANRPKPVSNGAGHGFSLNEIVGGLKSLRKTIFGQRCKEDDDTRRQNETTESRVNQQQPTTLATSTSSVCKSQSSSFLQLLSAKYKNG